MRVEVVPGSHIYVLIWKYRYLLGSLRRLGSTFRDNHCPCIQDCYCLASLSHDPVRSCDKTGPQMPGRLKLSLRFKVGCRTLISTASVIFLRCQYASLANFFALFVDRVWPEDLRCSPNAVTNGYSPMVLRCSEMRSHSGLLVSPI